MPAVTLSNTYVVVICWVLSIGFIDFQASNIFCEYYANKLAGGKTKKHEKNHLRYRSHQYGD